jgi:glucose/arabinose dehydrogenase
MDPPRPRFRLVPLILALTLLLALLALRLAVIGRGPSLALPAGFHAAIVVEGLEAPTAMAWAPDGRLLVAQQSGALRIIDAGRLLPNPAIVLPTRARGERGLLGLALDPAFPGNHLVYLYYTALGPVLHNRVSRFILDGDLVRPGSEQAILDLEPLSGATNHNGGGLHFAPDGTLYIGVGENARGANAQDLTSRLGKILRVKADGNIPSDNPFLAQTQGPGQAIWALGLRNPFTFAFAPGSGRLLINDVGASAWEEIDVGQPGANYGWPDSEGSVGLRPGFSGPLYAYGHGSGPFQGCAITGGTFYDPPVPLFPPALVGSYFFADYCGAWVHRLDPGQPEVALSFLDGIGGPVDLSVGPDGALYVLSRDLKSATGAVWRIGYGGR